MKSKILYSLLIILILFSLSSFSYGQTSNLARRDTRLLLSTSPENPAPGDEVTINIRSYAFNLLNSEIEWIANGQRIASGLGITSVKVTALGLGEENKITVIVRTENNLVLGNTVNFRPAGVDVIWSTDTYAPLFYKGQPLPSSGSEIIVEALPYLYNENRIKIADNDIYFNWFLNGTRDSKQSRIGNKFFTFKKGDRVDNLVLNVQDRSGKIKAEKEIKFENTTPKPQLYLVKPLIGIISDKTLDKEFAHAEEELTLLVEPFNVGKQAVLTNRITYQWKLDDDIIKEGVERKISFLRPIEESFDFVVELSGTNPDNIKQSFSISLPIIFQPLYEHF